MKCLIINNKGIKCYFNKKISINQFHFVQNIEEAKIFENKIEAKKQLKELKNLRNFNNFEIVEYKNKNLKKRK